MPTVQELQLMSNRGWAGLSDGSVAQFLAGDPATGGMGISFLQGALGNSLLLQGPAATSGTTTVHSPTLVFQAAWYHTTANTTQLKAQWQTTAIGGTDSLPLMNLLATVTISGTTTRIFWANTSQSVNDAGNTAFGFSALNVNSLGTSQTKNTSAFGQYALSAVNNALCDGSSAFGNSALMTVTAAGPNDAFGASSLSVLTTGTGNACFAYQTGTAITTGNYNTLGGFNTGSSLTTGSSVTAWGYQAGASLTTNGGGVFLGYLAGNLETAANKLYISNSNSATPLIKGTFGGNAAAALQFGDETHTWFTWNSQTGTSGVSAFTFVPGTAPSFAAVAGSTYSLVNLSTYLLTFSSGSATVTALNGMMGNIAAPTISYANTVTTASTWYVAGPPTLSGGGTLTNAWAIHSAGAMRLDGNLSVANQATNIIAKSNTAAALQATDGTNAYYTINTQTGTSGVAAHTFVPGTAPSFASASGSSYNSVALGAYTLTLTGGAGVTALNGLQMTVGQPTVTSTSGTTVTTASSLYVAGPPIAGGSVTITTALAADIEGTMLLGGTAGAHWYMGSQASNLASIINSSVGAITALSYALAQDNTGNTFFNAAATHSVQARVNNVAVATFQTPANFATAITMLDGTNTFFTFNTQTATDSTKTFEFAQGTAISYAAAAGSSHSLMALDAYTLTFTGTTTTTAMNGMMLNIAQPTLTDASAQTTTTASTVYIAGAPIAAGSVTITNAYALQVATGGSLFGGIITQSSTQSNGPSFIIYNDNTTSTAQYKNFIRYDNLGDLVINSGTGGGLFLCADSGTVVHIGNATTSAIQFGSTTNIPSFLWKSTAGAALEWLDTGNTNAVAMALNVAAVSVATGYVLSTAAITIGSTVSAVFTNGGGLQMYAAAGAAPTGGDKGIGTINVATNIYLNGVAYTSPDFVLEHYYTGGITKYARNPGASKYSGLMPLRDLNNFVSTRWHLPWIAREDNGVVGRFDDLLIGQESLTLYTLETSKRVETLEERVTRLEAENLSLKGQIASLQR